MRIIGGKWKGRKLSSMGRRSVSHELRPTLDRVRETIFNILVHREFIRPSTSRVLDLFCGTGAFGFEALSRGANHVCFVDYEKISLKIVKDNVCILGAQNCTNILNSDARKLGKNIDDGYDLIFLDPPYAKRLGELALQSSLKGGWLSDQATVIWEENVDISPPEGLILKEKRMIGNIHVNFLQRE